jgi:predicted nucleotide-binding protein (sugar kinase/HSP70/actin superfamily)
VLKLALKDKLEIWDGVIDLRQGKRGMADFFHEIAERTGVDTNKVRQAYRKGEERYQTFNKELTERINNLGMEEIFALETVCPPAIENDHRHTVALIGRSYNLFDPFINKDLLTLAKGLGIKVITSNTIPVRERERMVVPLSKEIYWETSREIVGSILYFAEHGIADGIIFVTSFKCGIDALMQEFLKRQVGTNKRGNIPFMTLTFDEHTAVEGIRTRLEAFLDLMDQRKGDAG